MLKSAIYIFFYIGETRLNEEYKMSTNIFARTSSHTRANSMKSKQSETAETAGSLASKGNKSYIAMNSYDAFTPSSPYSLNIDFSNYANYNSGSDSNGGFLSSFSNALATLGTNFSAGMGGFGGFSAGGASSGGGSCGGGGGGGFTSFV